MHIPFATREDGNLFLHIILTSSDGDSMVPLIRYDVPLTEYNIPKKATFNSLAVDVSKPD